MAEQYSNNAITKLNGGINNSQSTITVSSFAGFPTSPNYAIVVDGGLGTAEIMEVTGGAGTLIWNVTRNSESGGGANIHADQATVALVLTAASLLRAPVDHAGLGNVLPNQHHAQSHSDSDHSGANKVGVKNNAGTTLVEPIINFIPGTNITYTIADNSGAGRVDVTINASGGGGGAPTGAADGQLNGTYPNPGVDDVHGQTGVTTHHAQSHTNADHTGTGSVSGSAPGDIAGNGTGTGVAPLPHVHGREAWGVNVDIKSLADTAIAGASGKEADAGHQHDHGTVSGGDHTGNLTGNAKVAVRKNTASTDVGKERRLNFIEGTNVTLAISDDSASGEIDITINSSGTASPATFLSVAKWGLD